MFPVRSYNQPFSNDRRASGSDGALIQPWQFSSEYFDSATGLVYYNYRYYSPELGRWIKRDPIEEHGGVNLYGMVGNNFKHWDQNGLRWVISRRHEQRALAYSTENTDSLASLAQRVGHDFVGAFGKNGWLKQSNGEAINDFHHFNQLKKKCRHFSIPNTFLMAISELNLLSESAIIWRYNQIYNVARKNGFNILEFQYNVAQYTSHDIKSNKKNLYGFAFYGHGSIDIVNYFLSPDAPSQEEGDFVIERTTYQSIKSIDMKNSYNYGLIIVHACSSERGGWYNLASHNGYAHVVIGVVTLPVMCYHSFKKIKDALENNGTDD